MRVFRLSHVESYQSFAPVGLVDTIEYFNTDCTPRAATWNPPPVYVPNSRDLPGDFYSGSIMGLITRGSATATLLPILKAAGELLPIEHKGDTYNLLNVLNCIDCLDAERSILIPTEEPYQERLVFSPERLARSAASLFKISQIPRGEILCVEGLFGPEADFRAAVEAHGLVGLEFMPLWSE